MFNFTIPIFSNSQTLKNPNFQNTFLFSILLIVKYSRPSTSSILNYLNFRSFESQKFSNIPILQPSNAQFLKRSNF